MKPNPLGSRPGGHRRGGHRLADSKASHRPSTPGSHPPGSHPPGSHPPGSHPLGEQSPAEASSPQGGSGQPKAWQPRFGIGGLFLVVLIASVMAAAGSYLARTIFVARPQDARQSQLVFLLFTMAAPPLLMVLIALFFRFIRGR